MRRISTEQLRTGDRIGRDVVANPDSPPLLRAGIRVSDSYRLALQRYNITSVWIDDGLSNGIEPLEVLTENTKRRATTAIRDAFREVSHSLSARNTMAVDTVQEMTEVAELIVSEVAGNVHSALALNDLANADGYTMKHSLAVTALGLSLGLRVMRRYGWIDAHGERRFDAVEHRLSTLGIGLLLHDIGKLAVPSEILQKPGPLTDDEWQAMRAHTTLGVGILQHAEGISPLARAVVRSHHERWDGTGYAARQSGAHIHQFARIAAVADVFDALTSDRHYRRAMPIHEAWNHVVSRGSRDFDPEVVEVFRTSVAPYPPGTGVVLSDGHCGIVKEVRQDFVTLPIVRVVMSPSRGAIDPLEVDLSKTPGLTIKSADFDPWSAAAETHQVQA